MCSVVGYQDLRDALPGEQALQRRPGESRGCCRCEEDLREFGESVLHHESPELPQEGAAIVGMDPLHGPESDRPRCPGRVAGGLPPASFAVLDVGADIFVDGRPPAEKAGE